MYKVDHDIPFPGKPRNRQPPKASARRKYPYEEMTVGSSFFVPGMIASYLHQAVVQWGYRHNRVFRCRTVVENGVRGARCWRIE